MDPTAAEEVLLGWLREPPGGRPPQDLAAAVRATAERALARAAAGFSARREFWPDRRPADADAFEQEAFVRRLDFLTEELLAFVRAELNEAPAPVVNQVIAVLLEVALECRTAAPSPDDPRVLEVVRRRWVGLLARGVFGLYFRVPFTVGRRHHPTWGRFLSFVASEYLTDDALRHAREEHPAPVLDIETRLEECGHARDDLASEFLNVVHSRAGGIEFRTVAGAIRYFVTHAAYEWVDCVRKAVRTVPSPDDPGWMSALVARPPPREDPDIPDTWEQCRERFHPHTGDAARLLFLRLVRGPFPGVSHPANHGWHAVADMIDRLVRTRRTEHDHLLREAGADPSAVAEAFDLDRARADEADSLLAGVLAAVAARGRPHPDPRQWSAGLLASYYFFALIRPDSAFPTYPFDLSHFHGAEYPHLRDNATRFWLVDFLRYGYHLPRSVRSAEAPESPWESVVQLLRPVDDLITSHRVVRVTRLPPAVCWQHLTDVFAARSLGVEAIRQFHHRHARRYQTNPLR
jgi:hypothetical protein